MYAANLYVLEKEMEYLQREIERSVRRQWSWKPRPLHPVLSAFAAAVAHFL